MAYAIFGHGYEDLDAPRHTVPVGSMIVVSEECGAFGTLPAHLYAAMEDPSLRPLFLDPVGYQQALEHLLQRRIHIYSAGNTYPHMGFILLNDERSLANASPESAEVGPSGVWEIPTESGRLVRDPRGRGIDRYLTDSASAGTTFDGAVWPPAAERAAMAPLPLIALVDRPSLRVTMDQLVAIQPGIYYHFLCRNLTEPIIAMMREQFPMHADALFGRGTSVYNVPATVGDWLAVTRPLDLTPAQAAARVRLAGTVGRIEARRRASRTGAAAAAAESKATWNELMRRLLVRGSSERRLRSLVESVPDSQLNDRDPHDGSTLLLAAARGGYADTVQALVERGVALDLPDHEGITPLMAAQRNPAITEFLLAVGANPQARSVTESTAFHGASPPVMRLLMEAGLPPTVQDTNGLTPLHIAAAQKQAEDAAALLVLPGVDRNAPDIDGETPLMYAVQEADNPVIGLLLRAGVDLSVRSHTGGTALAYAFKGGEEKNVIQLLEAGAPVADWAMVKRAAQKEGMPRVVAWINAAHR